MIFGIKVKMYNFDPHNVFLAIFTKKKQRLKTGFVVQGHILYYIMLGEEIRKMDYNILHYTILYLYSSFSPGTMK